MEEKSKKCVEVEYGMGCSLLGFIGILGGIGLVVWPILGGLGWLFHDFKPGGSVGGLSKSEGWFCEIALCAVSMYYLTVAGRPWSRPLFILGMALHAALVAAIVLIMVGMDAGILIVPIMIVGPVLWFIHAAREQKLLL